MRPGHVALRQLARWVFAALMAMCIAAATVSCSIVAHRQSVDPLYLEESIFPVVQRLRIQTYWRWPARCFYLEYSRGSFSSEADDEFCRSFPQGDVPVREFDDQAQRDLEDLTRALREAGLDRMPSLLIDFDDEGRVTTGSTFSFDTCVSYVYWQQGEPPTVPDEPAYVSVADKWFKADGCA